MSFIESQIGILKQCTYETTVIVGPGVFISSTIGSEKNKKNLIKNLLITAQVSAAYFVSCISKNEISLLKSDDPTILENAAFTIGSGIVGGFVYYEASYTLDCYKAAYALTPKPSFSTADLSAYVFMSTGYSLAFSYVPRPYLTPAIFSIELGTSITPCLFNPSTIESALQSGSISGGVFAIIDIAEFLYFSYNTDIPEEEALANSDICNEEDVFALSLAGKDTCEIE